MEGPRLSTHPIPVGWSYGNTSLKPPTPTVLLNSYGAKALEMSETPAEHATDV